MGYVERAGLKVDSLYVDFIEDEVLKGLPFNAADIWQGLATLVATHAPTNTALLAKRELLQAEIDKWHKDNPELGNGEAYKAFLEQIDYLLPEGDDFEIETKNTDDEIAKIAGPQLVVPITNARYALNAANARWGSLYDALYGTDALGDLPAGKDYDPKRGARVVKFAKTFLDEAVPLREGSWHNVTGLKAGNKLEVETDMGATSLQNAAQYLGHAKSGDLAHILLQNNGLKIEVLVNHDHFIGKIDPAGIASVNLEAALSVIMDCEDSVATVDAEDKVNAYANWLGLMKRDLVETLTKGGKDIERALYDDFNYKTPKGEDLSVKCTALMLVRNVGHLMTTPTVLQPDGREIPEGLLDALTTILIAVHDLQKTDGARNSQKGSVYIVKPKMHGPEEVAFACRVFDDVEALLNLPQNTVKIGIMDEERRTSVNLKACIRAAKSRVAFINTGFLDRTGDEIHTSMEAGVMPPKAQMKTTTWLKAYENRNVDIGLLCGFQGRAQIGKGMWAMPDLMHKMLEEKIAQPKAGANCAWVPSPTAATLHALHYHKVDVFARQDEIKAVGLRARVEDLLKIPLINPQNLSEDEIASELDNNVQGILGYVGKWVNNGIGCSKIPDIHDIGQMEDRATCRISAQLLANWLYHSVISDAALDASFQRVAHIVDAQNEGDAEYISLARDPDGYAVSAAKTLVREGRFQPSGYTEPLLHLNRAKKKHG